MEKVTLKAPVIGEYEVQKCPICGNNPIIDASVKSEGTFELTYSIHTPVACPYCGLNANNIEDWNRLRAE